jgi:hypothetical protein
MVRSLQIVVRRVQIAERTLRAADEDAAVQKIQAELDRPSAFWAPGKQSRPTWTSVKPSLRSPVRLLS